MKSKVRVFYGIDLEDCHTKQFHSLLKFRLKMVTDTQNLASK